MPHAGTAIPNDAAAPISVGAAATSTRSLNATLQGSDVSSLASRETNRSNSKISEINDLFVQYGEVENLTPGEPFSFGEFKGAQILKALITSTPETPSKYKTLNNGTIVITISQTSFAQFASARLAVITVGSDPAVTINPDTQTVFTKSALNAGTYSVTIRDNKTGAEEATTIEVPYGGATGKRVNIDGTQRS